MNHLFGTTDPAIYGAGGTHAFFFFPPQIHIAARTALFRRAVIKTVVADFSGKKYRKFDQNPNLFGWDWNLKLLGIQQRDWIF